MTIRTHHHTKKNCQVGPSRLSSSLQRILRLVQVPWDAKHPPGRGTVVVSVVSVVRCLRKTLGHVARFAKINTSTVQTCDVTWSLQVNKIDIYRTDASKNEIHTHSIPRHFLLMEPVKLASNIWKTSRYVVCFHMTTSISRLSNSGVHQNPVLHPSKWPWIVLPCCLAW